MIIRSAGCNRQGIKYRCSKNIWMKTAWEGLIVFRDMESWCNCKVVINPINIAFRVGTDVSLTDFVSIPDSRIAVVPSLISQFCCRALTINI